MMRRETPWGTWAPAAIAEVAALFSPLPVRWWVAGGYAIELAAGRSFREHWDIDLLLLRRDQLAAQRAMPHWEWWAADPPGVLRPWAPDEILPGTVHDIWCRPGPAEPWRIQVMLDESDGDEWVSRRDPRVRRPVDLLGLVSPDGIPYLAPEVQLFYKAKRPRAKDEQDFAEILPSLGEERRAWLAGVIGQVYGDHPWTARLEESPAG
ncbi:nucleotidyltransferase domain-containing protein [Sphaerisporangium corydalis]|uniref:Nucleotidyltransferase domain-containing protein n=1 Tax=Sphaerisporangium corydalis TaxID=1441875 RepID=A0ABV9EDB1_9ACTN|nr:amino acid transporter [Sphaerisporangium corydalis]